MAGNRCREDKSGMINDTQWVITAYSGTVYRLAYAMMKNRSDADDIYQEVFLRYIRRRPVFQSTEHARAWLLRVTANCCKNHWKSPWADGRLEPIERQDEGGGRGGDLSRQAEAGLSKVSRLGIDPAQQAQEREQQKLLRHMIAELPEKYRMVIHLYYYEELSTEEIAVLLHRRASTVRTQLTRARELLKEILRQCGYENTEL